MTRGRIAAVLTCRDLGRTLEEALASVEAQTRPAAEIVVVDDASTDLYTRHVLAKLTREGTRVLAFEGGSAAAARNAGARVTSAEYLVCLDADDTLEPGYFEAAADRLDRDEGLDFVTCAMRAFGAAAYTWAPAAPNFVDAIATGGVPHASSLIRRRVWESVGGFDETLPSFELLDFWASALERGARGVVLDQPLLNYRIRQGSGYRRSLEPGAYRARLEHLYRKHRTAIERHGLELVVAKEAFILNQREHRQALEDRITVYETELAEVEQAIAHARRERDLRGEPLVDWGDLRRATPFSPMWGRDRGTPIDRYYIERFLDAHRTDISGRVLEVRDATYTRRFGGHAVIAADIVDIDPLNPGATIVADLRRAPAIPTASYDCIVLTQTLQLIDDLEAALAECARLLRPGGVLLATVPTTIRVDDQAGPDGDYWRLTEASARRLFAGAFPVGAVEVTTYGNVTACAAFLYALSVEEMRPAELDPVDARFPLLVAVRAQKADASSHVRHPTDLPGARGSASRSTPALVLSYHRIASLAPDAHNLCTPPDVFAAHMRQVRDACTPMALDDLLRAAASGCLPERAVAVTFDDGYLDALSTASPVLCELGIPATFFVNTERVSEEHERWWDVLERIFAGEPALPGRLPLRVGGAEMGLPTATSGERARALERLNELMWPLDAESRAGLVGHVLDWSGIRPSPRETHRVLTSGEVRALAARPGHQIGAHTTHHLALPRQPLDVKRAEILDDKRVLEQVLGRPVTLFAYPYGEVDPETIAVVREAGFHAALTVEGGVVQPGTNRFLLPRLEVTSACHHDLLSHLTELCAGAGC